MNIKILILIMFMGSSARASRAKATTRRDVTRRHSEAPKSESCKIL